MYIYIVEGDTITMYYYIYMYVWIWIWTTKNKFYTKKITLNNLFSLITKKNYHTNQIR